MQLILTRDSAREWSLSMVDANSQQRICMVDYFGDRYLTIKEVAENKVTFSQQLMTTQILTIACNFASILDVDLEIETSMK